MPKEAEMLEYALSLDVKALIISIVVIFAVVVAIYTLVKKVQEITGFETKSMKKRRIMEETIETLKTDIEKMGNDRESLQKQMADYSEEMHEMRKELLDALKDMRREILTEKIDNIRWTIIDFSNSLRSGRTYDLEAYNHIVDIDRKYEKLLEENGMENGRVTMAMKLVKEKYETGLRDGFPV